MLAHAGDETGDLGILHVVGVDAAERLEVGAERFDVLVDLPIAGDQTELILDLTQGMLGADDRVPHALTGDPGVLSDLGEGKILIIIEIEQLALLVGEHIAVEVEQEAHFKRFVFHGAPPV